MACDDLEWSSALKKKDKFNPSQIDLSKGSAFVKPLNVKTHDAE